jgi:hypothetical protein
VGWTLEATLLIPSNILPLGYGWIYHLFSRPPKNRKQYEVMINDYTTCSCMDFASMIASSLSNWGPWVPCKHLYYIMQYAIYSRIREPFIHYPSWSWNEVLDYYIMPKSWK